MVGGEGVGVLADFDGGLAFGDGEMAAGGGAAAVNPVAGVVGGWEQKK